MIIFWPLFAKFFAQSFGLKNIYAISFAIICANFWVKRYLRNFFCKYSRIYASPSLLTRVTSLFSYCLQAHRGRTCIKRKKISMVNFSIFVHKNVNRIGFQEIKIRPWEGFEKKAFFSLFLMRKRLSGGQKWFLRPYFSLIRGMFVFRSGVRFLFGALEVPEPRVRKRRF